MDLLGFLIVFPLVVAGLLLVFRGNTIRKAIVCLGALVIGVASLMLIFQHLGTQGRYYDFQSPVVTDICTVIDFVLGAIVLGFGIKYRKKLAIVLAIVQTFLALAFAFVAEPGITVRYGLYIDSLSLLMTFIIGVIGSAICFYALGYMDDFQEQHSDTEDRRPTFFAIMFLFFSAMFGIVFSNNMAWLFTAWEVTTVCSFLLIAYTRTEEAIKNAFRQIVMNMLGGIAFVLALFYCAGVLGSLSFVDFLVIGQIYPAYTLLPLVLFSVSGITKAAQMPFHTWLLGAMVAPTPTSALLHSSTMVKAGVFLLLKLAPIYSVTMIGGTMLILIGGITFALCSFMAISQSNAKRVLAYSTIANLGLIVACAGVGTAEAVWAGCFLMLFHAIAKSLLFCCVGTAEHHIGSRNIEDMDDLFKRMPKLARFMMLGIMTMFIAPFGMLLAKWATLVSFADMHEIALLVLLAYGSAATFMFWAKWLGKLAGIAGNPQNEEYTVKPSEWISIGLMTIFLLLGCAFLPLISDQVVVPYLTSVFGNGDYSVLSSDNLWIASACTIFIAIVLFAGLSKGTRQKQVGIYLSGISIDNEHRVFRNSLTGETEATSRNWYMEGIFGEQRIDPVGTICSTLIISVCIVLALVGLVAVL